MTEIGEQKRLRRLRRSAASIALALQLKTEEADDAIGASAIEVGLELASLQRGGADLPPGPDTDCSVESLQFVRRKAEVNKAVLPRDKPKESEEVDQLLTKRTRRSRNRGIRESRRCRPRLLPAPSPPRLPQRRVPKLFRRAGVLSCRRSARARAPAPGLAEGAGAHLDEHKGYPKERQQKYAEIQVRVGCSRLIGARPDASVLRND